MALKMVIDSDAVRERMALQDLPDINLAIDSALNAAHILYQSLLDTPFEPVTGVQEVFYLDPDRYPIVPRGGYRLRLGRAFVKASSVVVELGTDEDSFTAFTGFKVDATKGLVMIPEADGEDMYVRVTYSAGFDATNPAPDWLKEAILAQMPIVLNSQQTTNRSEEAYPTANLSRELASQMVEAHLRGTAFHYRPIY